MHAIYFVVSFSLLPWPFPFWVPPLEQSQGTEDAMYKAVYEMVRSGIQINL